PFDAPWHAVTGSVFTYEFTPEGWVSSRTLTMFDDGCNPACQPTRQLREEYINDEVLWRIGLLKERAAEDPTTNPPAALARTWLNYDDQPNGTVLNTCNLTQIEQWS